MGALEIAVIGVLVIFSFVIGAKVGQNVAKGETVNLPSFNPLNAIREQNDKKQAEKVQERIDTIMQNIEGYDGTSRGQKDVPRG